MRILPSLLAAALLAPFPAHAAAASDALPDPRRPELPPGERLGALVARMKAEHDQMSTLQADFVQRKESSFLQEPSVSRGAFYYKAPDQVRWEYFTPDPISLLIDGAEMTTWYRDLDRAERADVGRHSQQVLKYLGASTAMEDLLEYFTVYMHTPGDPEEPYELDLDPRYARLEKRIQEMQIWIHPELFLPVRLRYVEPDGDVTEYQFSELVVNGVIPPERFELELPRSVEVREVEVGSRAGAP